ncbi:type II toxin-antitoxin system RelE/ParE family toxin [Achromobacter spanius]|uniref:type II toxin-antitoxin system RelE/ParE family toxin n=1 Tax=Achromobacter spanius TaxID=217203 RepID=UPI003804412B
MGKPVKFWGSSQRDVTAFPENAKRIAGHELYLVQQGLDPTDWKAVATVGAGVYEIRVRDEESRGIFRIMYVAKFEDAIHVLHCFQKKTKATAQTDIDLAKERYSDVVAYVQAERAAMRKEKK